MSMSEFQNIKETVKTFPEKPEELTRCGSPWRTVWSDQRMPGDPVQSFENKEKTKSACVWRITVYWARSQEFIMPDNLDFQCFVKWHSG